MKRIVRQPRIKHVLLETSLNSPVRQLLLELMLALSSQIALQGHLKIGSACFSYRGVAEVTGILATRPDLNQIQIKDRAFSMTLNDHVNGIELSYVDLQQPAAAIYSEITQLCQKILSHLEQME